MGLVSFDPNALAQQLGQLSAPRRTAFAAAVAERLLPAYARFTRRMGRGDLAMVTSLLERVWHDLDGQQPSAEQVHDLALGERLIPDEDSDPWHPEHYAGEDAVVAVLFALRSRKTGEPQDAMWAAQRAYDALDRYVIDEEDIDTNAAGAESRVLAHPLIQAELSRQQRDLEELAANEPDLVRVAERLRERARVDAETFFTESLEK